MAPPPLQTMATCHLRRSPRLARPPVAGPPPTETGAAFDHPTSHHQKVAATDSIHYRMPASSLLRHTARMWTSGALSLKSSVPTSWRRSLACPRNSPLSAMYAASSWLFTLTAMVGLLNLACPDAHLPWPAAFHATEGILLALQGYWSYLSDVKCVGTASWAHPVDRASAMFLVIVQFFKFVLVLPRATPPVTSPAELAWVGVGVAFGVAVKVIGYRQLILGHERRYAIAHIMWHLSLPLVVGGFHFRLLVRHVDLDALLAGEARCLA